MALLVGLHVSKACKCLLCKQFCEGYGRVGSAPKPKYEHYWSVLRKPTP
jgi:hypothetical protein